MENDIQMPSRIGAREQHLTDFGLELGCEYRLAFKT
jgi:hypothetical protein